MAYRFILYILIIYLIRLMFNSVCSYLLDMNVCSALELSPLFIPTPTLTGTTRNTYGTPLVNIVTFCIVRYETVTLIQDSLEAGLN
jgi:hypothetical protein